MHIVTESLAMQTNNCSFEPGFKYCYISYSDQQICYARFVLIFPWKFYSKGDIIKNIFLSADFNKKSWNSSIRVSIVKALVGHYYAIYRKYNLFFV